MKRALRSEASGDTEFHDLDVLLHELKQPLFSAGIVSERLLEHARKLVEKNDSQANSLAHDVRILVTTLEQFREIVDLYAEVERVHFEDHNWLERFEQQIDAIEMIMESKNIDFSFENSLRKQSCGPDLAGVGHILRNLTTNAMIAADENAGVRRPLVLVQVARIQNNVVAISVHDSGAGIPSHLLPRIFERGVSSRLGKGGTGYGLWVCQKLAVAMGGSIEVGVSEITGGAKFVVTLPLALRSKNSEGRCA